MSFAAERDIMHPAKSAREDPVGWFAFTIRKNWPALAAGFPDLDEARLALFRMKMYAELRLFENREELIGQFDERIVAAKEAPVIESETEARTKRRTRARRKKAS